MSSSEKKKGNSRRSSKSSVDQPDAVGRNSELSSEEKKNLREQYFWEIGTKCILMAVMVMHLLYCPYNKVEESFNTQATFDILHNGFDLDAYDHKRYPGVVPRTFIGPLMLAIPVKILISAVELIKWFGVVGSFEVESPQPLFYEQILMRLVLAAVTFTTYCEVNDAMAHKNCVLRNIPHLPEARRYFLFITAAQPHLSYYASRTLPNSFALIFTNLAIAKWLVNTRR